MRHVASIEHWSFCVQYVMLRCCTLHEHSFRMRSHPKSLKEAASVAACTGQLSQTTVSPDVPSTRQVSAREHASCIETPAMGTAS
eukprot:3935156-Rhodomonas_salina.1